ncbi:MAG: tyrosine-type recombinase/integrase [Desulfosarcina sp.]|nr:tyrosine-type recombinase/integrase [Desulfosarcina sp.]MBC2742105.1 tyrosine-type recombinase/integrase [Desulfosarcina sp.]MBC2765018.1 tyrosine-type recombinase/integrase [Desulfosarcina sp.]
MAVTKLKDGRIVVAYRKGTIPEDPGRTREYFNRGPAGEKAAEKRNRELGFGKRKPVVKKTPPTFGDIAGDYQQDRFSRNTASTKDGRYYKLKSIILPELGHLPVDRLTHRRLDLYVNKRLKTQVTAWKGPEKRRVKKKLLDADGKPRFIKATTVHRELSDIMAIMAWAVENRKIAFNPVAGYKKPRRDDASIRPPSQSETRALLAHAPDHLVRAITLAWYTGVRPGAVELLSLRWSDVDMERRSMLVIGARKGGPVRRVVPLEDAFIATLKKWYKTDGENDNRHMITYNGKPILRIKTAWKNTKAAAGITRRLRPYDLRHAFVTYLLEDGADLKSVSTMAGHSRTDTTTRIYQHINMDLMRTSIAKMPPVGPTGTTELYQKKAPVNPDQQDDDK